MERDPYEPAPLHASPFDAPAGAPAATAPYAARPVGEPSSRSPWWTDRSNLREWAFLGGLLGGVLILLGAFTLALLVTVVQLVGAGNDGMWFLDDDNFPGVALAVALWGLVSGGLVLLGALRLKEATDLSAVPGAAMLLGGLLSFFALGGFLVGGLAAIVAGVMAIAAARHVMPPRAGDQDRTGGRRARPLS